MVSQAAAIRARAATDLARIFRVTLATHRLDAADRALLVVSSFMSLEVERRARRSQAQRRKQTSNAEARGRRL